MYFCRMCIAATTAAFILTTGCNKSREDETANSELRTVKIRLTSGPSSRAVGEMVVDDQEPTFSNGCIYFATDGGLITKKVEIGAGAGQVTLTALKAGVKISDITSNSRKVYVLGNMTLPSVTEGTTNISTVEAAVSVKSLYDDNGGVSNVPVYVDPGPGTIEKDTDEGAAADDYKAAVSVSPIAARIEIAKISTKSGAKVKEYRVTGIFITNYYSEMKLNAEPIADKFVDNGITPADYVGNGTKYPNDLSEILYDYDNAGIGFAEDDTDPPVYLPVEDGTPTDVWGYNLLPVSTGDNTNTMPHIVIRLEGVTTSVAGDPYSKAPSNGTWFLTIKNFYTNNKNGTQITKLARRTSYYIDNVEFNENDLTLNPNEGNINVTVTLSILNWIHQPVGIDFE